MTASFSQIQECIDLKSFVLNEELIGSKKWSVYHSDVLKYETGLSNKNRTIVLVRLIASEAIEVL